MKAAVLSFVCGYQLVHSILPSIENGMFNDVFGLGWRESLSASH